MNTTSEQNAAGVKPAITDADVIAWFKAKTAASGIPAINLGFNTSYISGGFVAQSENFTHTGFGNTADAAVSELRNRIPSPEKLAAQKRAVAAKLLAEADALAPDEKGAA